MSKITKDALDKIIEEIKNLEIQREDEKEVCANAKLQGDLSENNDYHDSKERLSFIDRRITELRKILLESIVVSAPKNPEYVSFGTIVSLIDSKGKKSKYKIVSDYESENEIGEEYIDTVSETSMIGKAMMSKKIGESVRFTTLLGTVKEYTIAEIFGNDSTLI
jgi:transcription elongation factor GreA